MITSSDKVKNNGVSQQDSSMLIHVIYNGEWLHHFHDGAIACNKCPHEFCTKHQDDTKHQKRPVTQEKVIHDLKILLIFSFALASLYNKTVHI